MRFPEQSPGGLVLHFAFKLVTVEHVQKCRSDDIEELPAPDHCVEHDGRRDGELEPIAPSVRGTKGHLAEVSRSRWSSRETAPLPKEEASAVAPAAPPPSQIAASGVPAAERALSIGALPTTN